MVFPMKTAYIGIGSNIGDPQRNCHEAIEKIAAIDGFRVISVSSFYLTEPVGVKTQEWYINGVVSISTAMPVHDLLNSLLQIEANMGRVRNVKWGPRIIDLDILLFGQDIIDEKDLKIPHPMMHLRKFVMAPIAELAPEIVHPVLGKTMTELLMDITESSQVIKKTGRI
jgi:2-amino-4-hydroxy-6-hydroxymethyldihydropteridine diphosphokinase